MVIFHSYLSLSEGNETEKNRWMTIGCFLILVTPFQQLSRCCLVFVSLSQSRLLPGIQSPDIILDICLLDHLHQLDKHVLRASVFSFGTWHFKPHDFWSHWSHTPHDFWSRLKSPPTPNPKTIPSQSYLSWYGVPICIHIVSHSQP